MKSTLFSKAVLLAGTALVLGSSTASFAGQVTGDWTIVPGSACFAEDRANVASFMAPSNAGIMLKAGEPAQWVVCPVTRSGVTGGSGDAAGLEIAVTVDKASDATGLYCYSSMIASSEDDGDVTYGTSGSWTELSIDDDDSTGVLDGTDAGITVADAKKGILTLTSDTNGLSKDGDPDNFIADEWNKKPLTGSTAALGVACLLSPGDKVLKIMSTTEAP